MGLEVKSLRREVGAKAHAESRRFPPSGPLAPSGGADEGAGDGAGESERACRGRGLESVHAGAEGWRACMQGPRVGGYAPR